MDAYMSPEDQRRLARKMTRRLAHYRRIWRYLNELRQRIPSLVEEDTSNLTPDSYEAFTEAMGRMDVIFAHLLRHFREDVESMRTVPIDASHLEAHIRSLENEKASLDGLREKYRRWVEWFEGPSREVERLEAIWNADEVEAERIEAYRTHGADLLRPTGGPPQDTKVDGGA